MSKIPEDDDLSYKDVRPGDIDDLFEDEDNLEVNEIPDESFNDEQKEPDDWDDYMIKDEDENLNVDVEQDSQEESTEDFEATPESENEEPEEDEQQIIEQMLDESMQEDSEEKTVSEESVNIDVESDVSTDEEEEGNDQEEFIEEDTSDNSVDSSVLENNETTSESDSDDVDIPTGEGDEVISNEEYMMPEKDMDAVVEQHEKESETTEDDDDDVVVESVESDSMADIPDDSSVDDESEEETQETVEEEKPQPQQPEFNPDDIKGPEEASAEEVVANGGNLKTFMNESFKTRVKNVLENHSEQEIMGFLKAAKDGGKDELDVLKDMYIQEYVKYSQFVNFNHPNAIADLWTLVAYEYNSYVAMKEYDKHGTFVESGNKGHDPNGVVIVEDPDVAAVKQERQKNEDKYAEYKLDRTIFDISDDEEFENSSIFEDKRTLMKDFYESPFYGILKEVMESDYVIDMSKVKCKVVINEQTSYLPVIDFSTGIRCICIDTSDVDQYHINAMLVSRKVPFSFHIKKGHMRIRILYADNCTDCPVATIAALRKLVGYPYFKNRYKTKLNHNYTIAYTTERKYVDMFEKGDPDSKTEGCSTYSTPKASNMALGVIVLDRKSEKDRQVIRRNQFRRDMGNMDYSQMSTDDYNIYFILSARIIRNDLRLRDPTYAKNERYVEYTIVQYTEHNKPIIEDGFQVITACIIKEHMRNYEPGTNYAISFELDRDNLVSPSVVGMIDEHDGVELSQTRRVGSPMDVSHQFILPPSRLKMEGVYPCEKGRVDARFFSPSSIMHVYNERSLWQNYDINTNQGRMEFIKSRGFEEFIIPAPLVYDVMPYACDIIETSDMMRNIQKVSIVALSDRNSEDTDNILFKQRELEYIKSLGGDNNYGGIQKFLFATLDFLIESRQQQNNS